MSFRILRKLPGFLLDSRSSLNVMHCLAQNKIASMINFRITLFWAMLAMRFVTIVAISPVSGCSILLANVLAANMDWWCFFTAAMCFTLFMKCIPWKTGLIHKTTHSITAYFSAADKDWILVQKLCEFCLQSTYMFPMSGWKLSSEWLRIGGWWTCDENVALQTDYDKHFSVHEWICDPVLTKLLVGLTLDTGLRVGDAWISLAVQQVHMYCHCHIVLVVKVDTLHLQYLTL